MPFGPWYCVAMTIRSRMICLLETYVKPVHSWGAHPEDEKLYTNLKRASKLHRNAEYRKKAKGQLKSFMNDPKRSIDLRKSKLNPKLKLKPKAR